MAKKAPVTEQGILDDVVSYLAEDRQIIYEDANFWVYRYGAFWLLPEADFRRAVMSRFPTLPFTIIRSVVERARTQLTPSMGARFFTPKPVVVFTDCTIEVSAEGLRARSHSPEDRARFRFTFPCPFEIPTEFGPVPPEKLEWREGAETGPEGGYARLLATLGEGNAAFEEFGGAVVLGLATKFKKALYLVGPKDAGKSQIGIFLRTLLSPPALDANRWIACVPPADMADKFRPADLASAILNLVDDKDRDVILTGAAKTAIAGGEFTASRKWGHPFTFRPRAGWLIIANEPPRTDDPALQERFLVVECKATYEKPVHDFGELVAITEARYAAGRLLMGAVRLLRDGYTVTESMREAAEDARIQSDANAMYLQETSEPALAAGLTLEELYSRYQLWAPLNGFSVCNKATFRQRLNALGHVAKKTHDGIRRYSLRFKKSLTPGN